MKYRIIKIQQLQDIKSIITMSETVPGGVYIHRGRYVVDASSIMGILTLDLSKPIELQCEDIEEAKNALEQYITEV